MKIHFVDGKPVLWAGTESSFDLAIQAQIQGLKLLEEKGQFDLRAQTYDGADGLPPMIAKQGKVGILSISGSLVDGEASYGRYYGVVGYDDIVGAAARLYSDPDVERVLVRIDSPGGMVDGIMDAGEALKRYSQTKPTLVYTGSMAASGGYWLATSFDAEIHVGPTAQLGSIGVVSVHTDLSGAYEAMGVKKTVLRSGENKARMNSIEPLTPELKAAEERKMADVHAIFRKHVGLGRPNLDASQLLEVTDGSLFLGKQAKEVGLADGVATFGQALKLLDSQIPSSNTPSKSKGASMKLSEQQIAMLQNGVPVAQLGLSAEDQAACQAQIDAVINAGKADEGIGGADKKPDVDAGAGAQPPPADVSAELTAATAQVTLLTKQLAEVNDKLVAEAAKVQNLTAAQEPLKAQIESLTGIARVAVGKLQITLGASSTAESMDATALVAAHTSLNASFLEKFKIGPVSKSAAQPETKNVEVPYAFRQMAAAAAKSTR